MIQVTQIDMTMKEHRSEMEQRIIRLEGALKKSTFDAEQRSQKVRNEFINFCYK